MALDSLPILRPEIYSAGQRFFQFELSKEEQDACLSQFKALDRNGDLKVTYQELLDKREIMGSSVAARVCRFFELVDGNGNGFLDFDECKALFFLVRKAHICDGCQGLIIHDGLSCLHCLPYSFKFCSFCIHHQLHNQHYQHLFQALPELINGSFQQNLPAAMALRAFPQQQHYHHSHGFQSLPPDQFQQQQQQHYRHSHGFQCQHPSDHHQAIAPSQAFHQDNNARTDSRGFMQTTGTVVAVVGSVAGVVNAINSCSIM